MSSPHNRLQKLRTPSRARYRSYLLCVFGGMLFSVGTQSFAADVHTIAGTGNQGKPAAAAIAPTATVNGPFGLVIGPDQALYICETEGHTIRRLDESAGHITIVAGTGTAGYTGDGGPAVKAQLNEPYEIRFDSKGNMFFVEMKNNLVRRVDAETGTITTVAGTGKLGFAGDGGPANRAQLNRPHSIVIDKAGTIYICDIGNHRIRRVDAKTGLISTFAGTGQKKTTPDGAKIEGTPLNGPRALDIDANGDLILALREGNAVYRLDMKTQTYRHLAGTGKSGYTGHGGPAKLARLSGPKGVAVGPQGDIYLADTESHTIRVIRKQSGIIETVMGDGNRGDGPDGVPAKCRLNRPHGVYVRSTGELYIGDSSNNKVRKLKATDK